MKLSERLQKIADEIREETMADIGSDHGFLPIYLRLNGVSKQAIIADISEGSIAKAKAYCDELAPGIEFDFRCGSGIRVLENAEVEAVVMAGMGGILIRAMLEDDMEKTFSIKKFIFQPRSKVGYLRYWLENQGFEIYKEKIARERGRLCEILVVKHLPLSNTTAEQKNKVSMEEYLENPKVQAVYDYPEALLNEEKRLLAEYFDMHIRKQEKILAKQKLANSESEPKEAKFVHEKLNRLNELRSRL